MAWNRLAKALGAALMIATSTPAVSHALTTYAKYRVSKVRVLAEGQWLEAQMPAEGEFLVVDKPSWPQTLSIETTWLLITPGVPAQKHCSEKTPQVLKRIFISRNNQQQPDPHPTISSGQFVYVHQNVPRAATQKVSAKCRYETAQDDFHGNGSAYIFFQTTKPLVGWDPGLPSPGLVGISKPSEGEAIPAAVLLKVWVQSKVPYPNKLGLEIQGATEVKTGVIGDIALPEDKPYITQWKPLKTLWLDVNWQGQPGNFGTSLQVPGYLTIHSTLRYGHHQAGYYRLRVLNQPHPPSAWRNFQVKGQIVQQFQKKP